MKEFGFYGIDLPSVEAEVMVIAGGFNGEGTVLDRYVVQRHLTLFKFLFLFRCCTDT
jgi:hypothetical protein